MTLRCPICLGARDADGADDWSCVKACGHVLHTSCLATCLAQASVTQCPCCRVSLLVEEGGGGGGPHVRAREGDGTAGMRAPDSTPCPPPLPLTPPLPVQRLPRCPLLSLPQTAVRVTRADPGHMRLFLENDDAGATSPGGAAGGTPAGLVS